MFCWRVELALMVLMSAMRAMASTLIAMMSSSMVIPHCRRRTFMVISFTPMYTIDHAIIRKL